MVLLKIPIEKLLNANNADKFLTIDNIETIDENERVIEINDGTTITNKFLRNLYSITFDGELKNILPDLCSFVQNLEYDFIMFENKNDEENSQYKDHNFIGIVSEPNRDGIFYFIDKIYSTSKNINVSSSPLTMDSNGKYSSSSFLVPDYFSREDRKEVERYKTVCEYHDGPNNTFIPIIIKTRQRKIVEVIHDYLFTNLNNIKGIGHESFKSSLVDICGDSKYSEILCVDKE